jgi:hypothetical protein
MRKLWERDHSLQQHRRANKIVLIVKQRLVEFANICIGSKMH